MCHDPKPIQQLRFAVLPRGYGHTLHMCDQGANKSIFYCGFLKSTSNECRKPFKKITPFCCFTSNPCCHRYSKPKFEHYATTTKIRTSCHTLSKLRKIDGLSKIVDMCQIFKKKKIGDERDKLKAVRSSSTITKVYTCLQVSKIFGPS